MNMNNSGNIDKNSKDSALVLFSAGQDSSTCLAWALDRFDSVETVGFDYGQRHKVELECRDGVRSQLCELFPKWRNKLGRDHTINLDALGEVSETALTREAEIKLGEDGLPTTFVPGRNLIFLTFAAAIAFRRGHRHLIGGMCETDFSGYPDCRDDTLKAMQVSLNLGMNSRFILHTPLMWLNKGQTWTLAHTIGGDDLVDVIREKTHTCYLGNREIQHEWGYGCGGCFACELRKQGYEAYKQSNGSR